MAAKGYCTDSDVAGYLALTFTAGQMAQADLLIEQAEAYMDNQTSRGWLMGAQTDEEHYDPRHNLFLQYAPVTSVTTITGRSALGESEAALTEDVDYEVRDLTTGHVYLVTPFDYDRIQVDYTPVATVPDDLKLACVEIVAAWLRPHLNPGSFGLDSYSLPDMTVKFSRVQSSGPIPITAQMILDSHRYRIHG